MGIWPFRRREKRSRKLADDGTASSAPEELPPAPRSVTAPTDTSNPAALINRRDSKRRKRESAPNNTDANHEAALVPSPPRRLARSTVASNSQTDTDIPNPSLRQPLSTDTFPRRGIASSQLDPNLSRASLPASQYDQPTLRVKKKTEPNLLRRKSDKRKRSDLTREQEIKKMVASQWPSGANNSRTFSHPAPLDNPDSSSIKVSRFRALAPRPMLRYKDKAQYHPPTRSVSRSSTYKGKHPITNEAHFVGEDRIDELADDMDAGALRELLERDRRRSMKSQGAQELVNKKLRRQEAVREGGTAGGPSEPDWPLSPSNYSGSWLEDASKEYLATHQRGSGESHVDHGFDRIGSPSASNERVRAGNKGIVYGTSEQSTSIPNGPNEAKRNSGTALGRSVAGLFRRTSSRLRKRPSQQPSSFSIPSRESITKAQQQQQQQQQQQPTVDRTPVIPPKSILRNATSGPSSHGASKFTEHLNDFPMPPSTVSPSTVTPYNAGNAENEAAPSSHRASACTGAGTIDRYSMSAISTRDGRTTGANSPEPRPDSLLLARSLASIDSEASWLSGKAPRRLSQTHRSSRRALKSTHSASERLEESAESGEGEGEGNTTSTSEEGVFGNIQFSEEEGKQYPQRQLSDQSARTVRAFSDADEVINQDPANNHNNEPWTLHSGVERRPQVVTPVAQKKSAEGLFTNYQESPGVSNPDSPVDCDAEIHRATSVDFGRGHARQISAGSARLLDLQSSSSRRPSDAKTLGSD